VRFLVDNALSPQIATILQTQGHDALHVRDLGLATAEDEYIFDHALQEDRIIISADTDFGTLLSLWSSAKPSVILFRRGTQHHPSLQAQLLIANLSALEDSLIQGAIVILEEQRIRVRSLPIKSDSRP